MYAPNSPSETRKNEPAKSTASTPASKHPAGCANPEVDFYFSKSDRWQKQIRRLRDIALGCQLTEALKWGCPCYTLGGSNIVLIHVFKHYCALLFFKGALLKDSHGVLVQQTKNVQAARQIRFTDLSEVVSSERIVKAYILEAIAVEESGVALEMKTTAAFHMPAEFESKLNEQPALKQAFFALTPGRQRAYVSHFSSAKQSATREARVEKNIERMLAGKGLDD